MPLTNGSGSGPDPAVFVIDLQDANTSQTVTLKQRHTSTHSWALADYSVIGARGGGLGSGGRPRPSRHGQIG
jgi:hypothetical protein